MNKGVIGRETAVQILQKQIDHINGMFSALLRTYQRDRLLLWLVGKREEYAVKFFREEPQIDMRNLLSVNLLIKRVAQLESPGGDREADDDSVPQMIDIFGSLIGLEENRLLVEEGFATFVAKDDFDLQGMDDKTLMRNFRTDLGDEIEAIYSTFEDNLIFNHQRAEEYLERHVEEYEKASQSTETHSYSPEEMIEHIYPWFKTMQSALTKNELYAGTFDVKHWSDDSLTPQFFLNLSKKTRISSYAIDGTEDKLWLTTLQELVEDVGTILDEESIDAEPEKIVDLLMHPSADDKSFPLFTKIERGIIVPANTIMFMGLFFYPMFYKGLMDSETAKRGEVFEKSDVPEMFRENGFQVEIDISDKKNSSLQIDVVAVRDNLVYVVECKIWGIKPWYEHRRVHEYLERDLKGVVDGFKYRMKNGDLQKEAIPSLRDKVEYIEEYLSKIIENAPQNPKIVPLVVLKSFPLIKQYKGVQFIHCEEIKNL